MIGQSLTTKWVSVMLVGETAAGETLGTGGGRDVRDRAAGVSVLEEDGEGVADPEAADVAGLVRGGHGRGEWGGGRLVGEDELVERTGLDTHSSTRVKRR